MHDLVHTLNWVDYGIIGIITISVGIGIMRGFVREAMSLLTWIAAISMGVIYSERTSVIFSAISMSGVRVLLAFILLVLSTLIVGGIISYAISKVIKITGFGFTDRIIGVLFGLARGVAIVSVLVLIVNVTWLSHLSVWQNSIWAQKFEPIALWIKEKLPKAFIQKLNTEDGQASPTDTKGTNKDSAHPSPLPAAAPAAHPAAPVLAHPAS